MYIYTLQNYLEMMSIQLAALACTCMKEDEYEHYICLMQPRQELWHTNTDRSHESTSYNMNHGSIIIYNASGTNV